ncbi:MAG TPA: phosphomethylpyrimidine synthase ThiC [bacterium]
MPVSPKEVAEVAHREQVPVEALAAAHAAGEAVIITSGRAGVRPVGIGKGLRAKFACIVGTSTAEPDMETVVRKAKIAVEQGAAVVHDGSAGGDVREMHRRLRDAVAAPLALCHPIGVMADACLRQRPFVDLAEGEFIEAARRDIEQGIEVLLLPLGISRSIVAGLNDSGRVMPCCSKSGSIMSAWIAHNDRENPYCRHFDEILALAKEHGTTLSVVGSFRSGCIHDALDGPQYEELKTMAEYVGRARAAGVQIMAGSGGHLPADRIGPFIRYQKELLRVPITCFGPQVTDISLGFDHASAAMGQIIALLAGADEIFAVTPAEHLGMPDEEQTREGCIVAALACHGADLARGKDREMDHALSVAREAGSWKDQLPFARDERVRTVLRQAGEKGAGCSVCGDVCAYRVMSRVAGKRTDER